MYLRTNAIVWSNKYNRVKIHVIVIIYVWHDTICYMPHTRHF